MILKEIKMSDKYSKELKELAKWAMDEKGLNQQECDDFVEYCQERGLLNPNTTITTTVLNTKLNWEKLFKENSHFVRKISKLLKLTYKELADLTGYSEGAFRNAVNKNELSAPMEKSLQMLLKISKLEREIQDLKDLTIKSLLQK